MPGLFSADGFAGACDCCGATLLDRWTGRDGSPVARGTGASAFFPNNRFQKPIDTSLQGSSALTQDHTEFSEIRWVVSRPPCCSISRQRNVTVFPFKFIHFWAILGVAHANVSGLFSRGAVWCCFGSRQDVRLTCCFSHGLNEIVSFRTQGSQSELREGVRAVETNETVEGERAPTIERFGLQD